MVVKTVWASDTAVFKLLSLLIRFITELICFQRGRINNTLNMSCNPFIQLFKFNHQMIMPFRWINCFKILRSDLKVRQKLLLQLEILCFVFLILKLIHHFYKKGLLNKNNKHLHLTYKSNSCCFFSSSFSLSLYVFCKGKGHTYFETWSSVSLVDGTSNSDDSIMYLFVWLFRSFG